MIYILFEATIFKIYVLIDNLPLTEYIFFTHKGGVMITMPIIPLSLNSNHFYTVLAVLIAMRLAVKPISKCEIIPIPAPHKDSILLQITSSDPY